jgi:hypothetical protein
LAGTAASRLTIGGAGVKHAPMPRTMRVGYAGAIYHVMDWGDRLRASERAVNAALLDGTRSEITTHTTLVPTNGLTRF